jgi:signal transduction histidine kinase
MEPSAHPFFEGFAPHAKALLLARLVREEHPASACLFQEGDAADGVYLILEGEVDIIRSAGKREKILDLLKAGNYFGEVAVLDGRGRSTTARARTRLTVAKIPSAIFLEVLATEPGTLTLALFRNVLDRLRHANDLVMTEVVHKQKLALVGEMASSLMHDLRTPVTSIRVGADLISMTFPQTESQCDGIRLQCDRLVSMAVELMEFSRGETKLTLGRTTTHGFLDQFRKLNESYLANTEVKVEFSCRAGEIEVDSLRLQRVLQNLVNNAIDALFDRPKPKVKVSAFTRKNIFYLTVADNGPGIPAEIHSRIYEPFVTHGKAGGTGLGMAIVRNIVTAHGGTITFETSPDAGTTFQVEIPQAPRSKEESRLTD